MASSGLLSLVSGAAKYGMRQNERRQDEASEERKFQRKLELEQQLREAQLKYARANPKFERFITDAYTGNMIGFDEFGNSRVVRESSPEERVMLQEDRELKRRAINADIESKTANAESQRDYRKAMAAAASRNADTRANPPPKITTPKGPKKTEAEYRKAAINTVKTLHPDLMLAGWEEDEGADEVEAMIQKEIAALKALEQRGDSEDAAPSNDFSADLDFSSLIPKN